ncbi:MAG: hypothetical protein ABIQ95_00715 [Bdellovibrionia bacterium]
MSAKEFKRFMDSQIADLSSTEVNEILDCELPAQDGPSTSAPQMAEINKGQKTFLGTECGIVNGQIENQNNEQICADVPPAYTSESYKKRSRVDRIYQQLRLAPSVPSTSLSTQENSEVSEQTETRGRKSKVAEPVA